MKKVAVIGAGISGLCVAFRAQKAGADVSLFDAAGQVGGNIHTVTNGAYTYEHGPNSLMANSASSCRSAGPRARNPVGSRNSKGAVSSAVERRSTTHPATVKSAPMAAQWAFTFRSSK